MAGQKTKLWNDGRLKGGIRERSPGTWQIIIEGGRDPRNGKRRQVRLTVKATSVRQVRDELRRLLTERAGGNLAAPNRFTVAEFLERWYRDYVVANVRPMTAQHYRSIINIRLKPALGSVPLGKLTAAHIVHMYTELRGPNGRKGRRRGPLSGYSLVNTHRVLKEALSHAVEWNLLRHNPASGVRAPKVERDEMRALTAEETTRLLRTVAGTKIGPLVMLAVHTGMRRSELLGLRWGDVNLDLATVQVVRTLHSLKGGILRYEEPKSRHGRRPVDLSPAAVAALRQHREHAESHAAQLELRITDETPVFFRDDLSVMRPDTVSHDFEKATVKAGLGKMGLHVLRHTHASLMLKQGVHPLVVSRRLGHATVQITLDTYSHVVPSIQKAAAMAFQQALTPDAEQSAAVATGQSE